MGNWKFSICIRLPLIKAKDQSKNIPDLISASAGSSNSLNSANCICQSTTKEVWKVDKPDSGLTVTINVRSFCCVFTWIPWVRKFSLYPACVLTCLMACYIIQNQSSELSATKLQSKQETTFKYRLKFFYKMLIFEQIQLFTLSFYGQEYSHFDRSNFLVFKNSPKKRWFQGEPWNHPGIDQLVLLNFTGFYRTN